jgi:diguanylate cyclase (GGDEF)-like protein
LSAARKSSNRSPTWHIAGMLALLLLAFVTTIAVSIGLTVVEINNTEAGSNRRAVAATLSRDIQRIEQFAIAHDDWDDEILEDPDVEPSGAAASHDHIPVLTVEDDADGRFDRMWVLTENDQQLLTVIPAANQASHHAEPDGGVIDKLKKELRSGRKSASMLQTHDDMLAIYVMIKLEADSELLQYNGHNKSGFLVIHEDVDSLFLNETGDMLQLRDLAFYAQGRDLSGLTALPVADDQGKAIGSFAWQPVHSKWTHVRDQLPIISGLALVFLLVASVLMRRLQSSVRYLQRQARIDWLSQLPNRWSLQHAIRSDGKSGQQSALAMIDLDSFKTVNDFHGHKVGDEVLKHVARLLTEIAPRGAMVARLGGDEFAILATGDDCERALRLAAEDLLAELTAPIDASGHSLIVGCSIGIALSEPNRPAGDLLRRADIAMYAAKHSGKMCYALYDPQMELETKSGVALKDDLVKAMQAGAIGLKYQPIMSARSGEIVAVEALARWSCAKNGNVPPDEFIPIAERFGLIGTIGSKLLMDSCRDCAPLGDVRLAVNISAAQISRPDFVETVVAALAAANMPVERFELEITETSLVKDGRRAKEALDRLSAMGVRITLDDFGSGYASIGFLRQFRFDALKIDRSIVADCTTNPASRGMIMACIAMANAMGIEVVAEGIETEEQAVVMRAAGCHYLQGWLYSRAVHLDELPLKNVIPKTKIAAIG